MKKRKVEKKMKNCKKKKKRNALWITIVIHSAFGCAETVIFPTSFSFMYNKPSIQLFL